MLKLIGITFIIVAIFLFSCKNTEKLSNPLLHTNGLYRYAPPDTEFAYLIRVFEGRIMKIGNLEKPEDNGKYDACYMCGLDTLKAENDFKIASYQTKGDSIFFKFNNELLPYTVSYAGKIYRDSLVLGAFISDYDPEFVSPPKNNYKVVTYKFSKARCNKRIKVPVRDYKGWTMEN